MSKAKFDNTKEFENHVASYWTTNQLGEEFSERLVFAQPDGQHFRIDCIAIGHQIIVSGDLGCAVFYYYPPRNLRSFASYSVSYALEKVRSISQRQTKLEMSKTRMAIILTGMRLAFAQIDAKAGKP